MSVEPEYESLSVCGFVGGGVVSLRESVWEGLSVCKLQVHLFPKTDFWREILFYPKSRLLSSKWTPSLPPTGLSLSLSHTHTHTHT